VTASDADRWSRHTRYYAWSLRLARPIAFGSEIWVDPETRPQNYEAHANVARRRGGDPGPSSIGYAMTSTLLWELVMAAGAVETEHVRLGDALDAAQEWTDDFLRQFPPTPEEERAPEGVHHTVALPLLDAHHSMWNMLTWTRAVDERLKRDDYDGEVSEPAGLIPAMAEHPRRQQVVDARARFRSKVGDTRHFANFVLHGGGIPGGGTPSAIIQPGGSIRVPFPDPSSTPIRTWHAFEYALDRDMRSYADDLMSAVQQLIDAVLTAFEEHLPERFRTET
jgi:hypothetical protein